MRSFFLLLVLANVGYFAWQLYSQPPPAVEHPFGPLTLDDHTPPLMLLSELPKPPPPAANTQPQREPALQELPPTDTTAEPPL